MPLMNRPRVVIDGVRRTRTYRFFWCSHCDRTVRIASASPNPLHNFLCPLCYNLVCQEIDISRNSSNLSSYRTGSSATSASAAQLLDTMAQIINLSSPRRPTLRPLFTTHIGHISSSRPLPRPVSPQENALSWVSEQEPPSQTPQNQTTENNDSSCITDVRATSDALCSDSACPICKEDFVMNQEIRKLACNHFYHSNCIMSWLHINNTCPVCRYQLPLQQGSSNNNNSVRNNNFRAADYGHNVDDSDDDYDLHLEDVVSLSWPSWAELISLLRPFRFSSLLDWS